MLNTKLILVDGITGSGKSTTAHYIARQLEKNGIKVKWFHEKEKNHPLHNQIETKNDEEYLNEILKSFYKQLTEFVDMIANDEAVYIIESFLFQDIVVPFLSNASSKKDIHDFYGQYHAIIAKLNPVLIHYYQQNTEASLKKTWNDRGGDLMKNMYIEQTETLYHKYCKSRNIKGEYATISFWNEVVLVSKELYETFNCRKIQIENSAHDWDNYRKQVLDFLGIKQVEEKIFDESYEEYCGFYLGRIKIHIKDNRLCADWFWPDSKLLQLAPDEFEFEGWPIVIKFLRDENNKINSLKFIKVNRHAEVDEERHKIVTIELNNSEKELLCGEFHCESDKLVRRIYLKDNNLYYRRGENHETQLLPVSQNKLFLHGASGSILTFKFVDGIKQFILVSPNQPDLLFTQTNS